MVSSNEDGLIYNIKLSSVGPGRMTGQDIVHEPSDMDLAMKLHYIRAIYYFSSQAFEGLNNWKVKEPMFTWFNQFYTACGRFRRSETGRPYIKCNDCGARFIEAQCDKTLDEWLDMKVASLEKLLVSNQVIGPELAFSPLVLMQYTRFKCGGISVGLSWAHVLGDAFSAAEFMNTFGKVMSGYQPPQPLNLDQALIKAQKTQSPEEAVGDPISVKRIGPVEDNWTVVHGCNMETFSFHVTPAQLSAMQSKMSGKNYTAIPPFESICAAIWQCIAKIRHGGEPKIVTICQNDSGSKKDGILCNSQRIYVVKAEFPICEANPSELASLIKNFAVEEGRKIEEAMEKEQGLADFIIYGANLTFVDLEDAKFYEFEHNGEKPASVSCFIDGVGDEGTVLVLPGPEDVAKGGNIGRIVTVTLPEHEVMELKSELKKGWIMV